MPLWNTYFFFIPKEVTGVLKGFYFEELFFVWFKDDGLIFLPRKHIQGWDSKRTARAMKKQKKSKFCIRLQSICFSNQATARDAEEQPLQGASLTQLQLYCVHCMLWNSMPSSGISDSFRKQLDRQCAETLKPLAAFLFCLLCFSAQPGKTSKGCFRRKLCL